MKLNRAERDNYVITYATDPPLTGTVQASFDGGENWIDGTPSAGAWAWLVYGPDFDPTEVSMTAEGTAITDTTTPLLRMADDPVLDVVKGPSIRLWG